MTSESGDVTYFHIHGLEWLYRVEGRGESIWPIEVSNHNIVIAVNLPLGLRWF